MNEIQINEIQINVIQIDDILNYVLTFIFQDLNDMVDCLKYRTISKQFKYHCEYIFDTCDDFHGAECRVLFRPDGFSLDLSIESRRG